MEAPGIPLYIGINGNGAVTTIRFPFSMVLRFVFDCIRGAYRVFYIEVSGFHLKGSGVFLAYLDVFVKVEVFRLDDNRHDRKVVHDNPIAAWSFTGDLRFGGDNLCRLVSEMLRFPPLSVPSRRNQKGAWGPRCL